MTGARRKNTMPPPWAQEAEGDSVSFGTWLRRQRELREVSLREIAEASKISLRYLEAFEKDRFDILPAPVFTQGFLRQYARYVGLDGDDVVNSYLRARQELEPEDKPEEPPDPGGGLAGINWAWAVAISVAILVLLGLVAFLSFLGERRSQQGGVQEPPPMAAPVLPAPPPPIAPPPPAVSSKPLRVTLDFSRECWVEAVVDGQRTVGGQILVQGESLHLEAEQAVDLVLGDSGAVTLEVNGRPYQLPAAGPGMRRSVRIDRGALEGSSPEAL